MGEDNEKIHEHLQNLIEGSTMHWTYAILWKYNSHPQRALSFRNGYYRGTGKSKEVRILGSRVTVTEEVTDAEWFYKISMGQSFRIKEDMPGHALWGWRPLWVTAADTDASRWERTTWGHGFGIQTFLCISLKDLQVLELASTQIIHNNLRTIEDMADFIYPIGIPRFPIKAPKQLRNDRRLHERTYNEMQNRESNDLSKQSLDKEKINDSKCSWPLLTESSNGGTDRTFSHSYDYSGPS